MNYRSIALSIALAAAISLTLPGCERTSNLTEQEHIQRAKDFEDKGDLKGSIVELKNAIQKNPDSPQARLLLGQIYVKAGMGAEAEKELTKAAKLGVSHESVQLDLGEALLLMGEYKRVLDEIQPGEKTTKPNLAHIWQLRGDAMHGLRRLDEGCALFKQSIELDATHVPSHWGLARCALAMSQLNAAIKVEPKNPNTWTMMGDLERGNNNLQGAEAAYGQALKADPQHPGALVSRALLYISESKPEQAQADLDRLHKLAPDHYLTNYLQAALLYSTGKYTEAMDTVQQVLKALPNYMPAVRLAGILHYNLNSYEQSVQSLRRYLQAVPGDTLTSKLLAATYLKLGQTENALDLLKPLMHGNKDDAQLYMLVGQAQLQEKDPASAAAAFEKAAALDPKNVVLNTQLGLSLIASGDQQKGVQALQASSKLDSKQVQSDVTLSVVYLQNRQYDKALETLVNLEKKLAKEDSFVHELKGVAFIGKKDFASARMSLERALAIDPTLAGAAISLAQLDLRDKKPEIARKRLERVLEKNRNSLVAMLALADLAAAEGKEQAYVDWLVKAAKSHPKVAKPQVLLARYYIGKNQPKQALTSAQAAVSAQADDPAALLTLGNVQLATGDQENALTTFKRLVMQAPNDPSSHYHTASAQAAAGNLAGARQSLKRALALKADYPDALTALATVEMRDGKPAEALKVAQQIKKLFPASALGAAMEGDALMVQKRYMQAVKAYDAAWSLQKNGGLVIKIFDALNLAGQPRDAEARMLQWLKEHPDDKGARLHFAQAQMAAGSTSSYCGASPTTRWC
jgi:putative PEP-CTERM system TPR-repeat lipoprotein